MTRRRCLLAVMAAALAACDQQHAAPSPPASTPSAERPPAPRPEGVIASAVVPAPARLLDDLRPVFPDDLALAPEYGALVSLLVELPVTSAASIDEAGPLRALAWAPSASETDFIVAVPLRAADALLAQVSSGQGARHRTRRDEAAGLDWIEPLSSDVPAARALAVARNCLVVGSSPRVVAACGAYLAHPPSPELAPGRASLSVWSSRDGVARLLAAASVLVRAGRGPEWGALVGLLSSDDEVTRLSSARELTLEADVDSESITLQIAIDTAESAPAACATGPASELTDANAEASLAIATFSDAATRQASAERAAGWLEGAGLSRGERGSEVKAALGAIARARGGGTRLAVELSEVGWLAYGSSEVSDPRAATDALDALREALGGGVEGSAGLELRAAKAVVENVGDAVRLRLVRREPTGEGARPVAAILARVHGRRLVLATGPDPAYALRRELDASGAGTLGARAELAGLVSRVDASASSFVYADLAALRGKPRGARLFASISSCGGAANVKAALSHRAAGELAVLLRERGRP